MGFARIIPSITKETIILAFKYAFDLCLDLLYENISVGRINIINPIEPHELTFI